VGSDVSLDNAGKVTGIDDETQDFFFAGAFAELIFEEGKNAMLLRSSGMSSDTKATTRFSIYAPLEGIGYLFAAMRPAYNLMSCPARRAIWFSKVAHQRHNSDEAHEHEEQ
jgi:hypothetical protein